jgi:hypothetical protein
MSEEINITDSDVTAENLLSIEDFNKDTKERIKKSDILLVPLLEFRDRKERVFYPETSNFLKFANKKLDKITIDLCENKGQEKTLDLHYDELLLPIIFISVEFVRNIGLPILTSLISNYIFYRFSKKSGEDESIIHVQIIINDNKKQKSKKLDYKGPLSGLNKFKKIDINKIFGEK